MPLDRTERRLLFLWGLLVAISLASWGSAIATLDRRLQSSVIIILAFAKVGIIAADFMEIRRAPMWLKIVLTAWVLVVGGAILTLLWAPIGQGRI